jgi:hypothetical protein
MSMFNCYKVFVNGRLYAIVHTESAAKGLSFMLFESDGGQREEVRIEGAYIPGGVGF